MKSTSIYLDFPRIGGVGTFVFRRLLIHCNPDCTPSTLHNEWDYSNYILNLCIVVLPFFPFLENLLRLSISRDFSARQSHLPHDG